LTSAQYVKSLASATSPIVLVIVSGRPRLLNGIADVSAAVIEAYLPGPMGGQAVAEVISGLTAPSGRIPFSYPKSSANIPYPYHHKVNSWCSYGNCQVRCPPCSLPSLTPFDQVEWEFGTGLSYSTFTVTDLKLSASAISSSDSLTITALVSNTGAVQSKYTALLFVTDVYRRVTPEYKLLKR
jgi:beta-glucosidase